MSWNPGYAVPTPNPGDGESGQAGEEEVVQTGWVPASADGPASLDFGEDTDNGSNRVRLIAPAALSADFAATLPALDGTLLVGTDVVGTGLATSGTVNLDMTTLTGTTQQIALAGNITFTMTNGAAGRHMRLILISFGTNTVTFPGTWSALSPTFLPTNVSAQRMVIDAYCTSGSDVFVVWRSTTAVIASTSGSISLNFSSMDQTVQHIVASGNITFTTTALAPKRNLVIFIDAGASTRTITYPGTWRAMGSALVTSIPSGKRLVLSLMSLGTTDADVSAATSVQP